MLIVYNMFFTPYHAILQYNTPDAFPVLYGECSTDFCFDPPTQSSLNIYIYIYIHTYIYIYLHMHVCVYLDYQIPNGIPNEIPNVPKGTVFAEKVIFVC